MDDKIFKKVDVAFICDNCKCEVKSLGYTSRDHCPYCLYGKHVDVFPGDRKERCHGLLIPKAIEKFKDTYKIIYKCDKCDKKRVNICAKDDNMDLIIDLSVIKN